MPHLPRLVIAGLAGDAGKTLVSVGLTLALRERGVPVCAFKKGPDYIDTAWLTWASGRVARNLDTHLMGADIVRASFLANASEEGINIIEGNRGVYDGSDARGTHSTAQIAKLLGAPIVLVVDAAKVTRTAAACVLGCQALDPDVPFAGVVLNRVAGRRHERVLREAMALTCALPVLGAIRRSDGETLLPGRHLGLVTPAEHERVDGLAAAVRGLTEASLEIDRIVAIARQAPALPGEPGVRLEAHPGTKSAPYDSARCGPSEGMGRPDGATTGLPDSRTFVPDSIRIGYVLDSAFTFYYPENLEALEAAGATLVPVSALTSSALPADLDALYIGGGFPETHAAALSSNARFLASLADAARRGLPIYAECGGLMMLSRAIRWHGRGYSMAGVLPLDVEMQLRPQGHGYTQLVVDRPNPFFAEGTGLKGHEFHYSRVSAAADPVPTACAVVRGTGCLPGRDGIVINQAFASYTHLHALATPQWAPAVVAAARRYRAARTHLGPGTR